jgi:pilus assembly protein Flp/PilA
MRRHTRNPRVDCMNIKRCSTLWLADESGVTAIEYGLLAALIVIAIIGALTATNVSLSDLYTRWATAVLAALS